MQTGQTGIFVGSRSRNDKLLSAELTNIKGGMTYVVDITKRVDDEQTLVFGDILRTVYAVKVEAVEDRTETAPGLEKVIVFVDELNRYTPGGGTERPITQQVLDVGERGGIFVDFGIRNFLEGDFWGWYLEVWDEALERALRRLIDDLADDSLATP